MLIGTDFNEFTFDISRDMTWEEAEAAVRQRQGEKADQYIAAFRKAYPNAQPKEEHQPICICLHGNLRATRLVLPMAWSYLLCYTTSVCSVR